MAFTNYSTAPGLQALGQGLGLNMPSQPGGNQQQNQQQNMYAMNPQLLALLGQGGQGGQPQQGGALMQSLRGGISNLGGTVGRAIMGMPDSGMFSGM